MSRLIITRTPEWNIKFRSVELYVNNKEVGRIGDGETREYELEPGDYQVEARIDWCGSQVVHLQLQENEVQQLGLVGFKFGRWLAPFVFIVLLLDFSGRYIFDFEFSFFPYAVIPVGLYLLYYISFGRNRYLRLKPIGERSAAMSKLQPESQK